MFVPYTIYMVKAKIPATTFKVSGERWSLYQQKVLKDKMLYLNKFGRPINLNPTRILNAYMWLILKNKIKIDLTFGMISDATDVRGTYIDPVTRSEMKKYIIDYEVTNKVPHPIGISGVICRIVEAYLRMDFREVASKYLEWEKRVIK